jgi:hypothetical protein
MVRIVATAILILFWLASLGAPVVFLFAAAGTSPLSGPLGHLYWSGVQLFGETGFRILFCTVWWLLNALLFWRLVLRRGDATPADGLADYD